jgi:DNA-binding IclR family transcriptional regulator
MSMPPKIPGAQTLQRALKLLNHFTLDHAEWSVTDLAMETGLNRTTVYRLLSDLETLDMLHRDPQSQEFRLGSTPMALQQTYLTGQTWYLPGLSGLEQLVALFGQTATLEVPSRTGMLIVAICVDRPLRQGHLSRGSLRPWNSSAGALALSAIYERLGFDQAGIDGAQAQAIRSRGYAVRASGRTPDSMSIAAAVPGQHPCCPVAICLSGPTRFFGHAEQVGQAVKAAADRIGRQTERSLAHAA